MADFISQLDGPEMDDALLQVNARTPEAWAAGTRAGVPVGAGDETYNNNAKYWAQVAKSAVPAGSTGAVLFSQAQQLPDSAKQVARTNIGAVNGANIIAGGKNLFSMELLNASRSAAGVKISIEDRVIKVKGNAPTGGFYAEFSSSKVFSLPAGTYSFEAHNISGTYTSALRIRIRGTSTVWTTVNLNTRGQFTLPSERNDLYFAVLDTGGSEHSIDCSFNIQLEVGTVATTYEPYYESNLVLTQKVNWDLLWENASSTSAFASQQLNIATLNNYEKIYVVTRYSGSSNVRCNVLMIKESGGVRGAILFLDSGTIPMRRMVLWNDTTIEFSDATQNGATNNAFLIPLRIYGIR